MSSRDGLTPEYPTAEEWATLFSEAVLKPLRDVGELLAKEVDELNETVADISRELAELGRKVDELGVAAGLEAGEHSTKAAPDCVRCGHSHTLHVAAGCLGRYDRMALGACGCVGYLAPERVPVTS